MRHVPCLFTLAMAVLCTQMSQAGPYAPAAGVTGSTAIYKTDVGFTAWASGYQDYLPGAAVDEIWKTPELALGPAAGDSYDIVCLGAGGRITLTFDKPIANGAGADFAVFENAITDGFLELAYVEVSADGANYFRFPSASLTTDPVTAYGTLDPTNINGLAGKYRQGYGTPFDLSVVGLSSANFVRILDIVGDGSALDSSNRPIYDPYPNYGSAGFDLDAVGVIHQLLGVPGDFSGDGMVNVQDINPFVAALANEAGFFAAHPNINLASVDLNADGHINVQDINPFVDKLAGAGVAGASLVIPEPAVALPVMLLAIAFARRR
ncbi:MAG: hypothetical protein IT441_08210 [Phycisphaeraceae bacterium]|nr:hypothetical protein [Phycisphaeraceae bacterium]